MKISAAAFIAALFLAAVFFPSAVLADGKYHLFIMPKLVGITYYDVVKQGIDDAMRELPDVGLVKQYLERMPSK